MNETKRFKAIPGIGVPSSLLIGRMKDGKPGDTLTDDELGEEILTTAESDVQSVRRKSKRALRRVGLVDRRDGA